MDSLLSIEELAEILQVPKKTIYAWRTKGLGPRALRVGKFLRFRRSDVNAWLDQQAEKANTRTSA